MKQVYVIETVTFRVLVDENLTEEDAKEQALKKVSENSEDVEFVDSTDRQAYPV